MLRRVLRLVLHRRSRPVLLTALSGLLEFKRGVITTGQTVTGPPMTTRPHDQEGQERRGNAEERCVSAPRDAGGSVQTNRADVELRIKPVRQCPTKNEKQSSCPP